MTKISQAYNRYYRDVIRPVGRGPIPAKGYNTRHT